MYPSLALSYGAVLIFVVSFQIAFWLDRRFGDCGHPAREHINTTRFTSQA